MLKTTTEAGEKQLTQKQSTNLLALKGNLLGYKAMQTSKLALKQQKGVDQQ